MIRTVLGDIEVPCGSILMHEHIQCVSKDMLTAFGSRWLDEEKLENYAVDVLNQLKEKIGLSAFVDGTPIELGRNIKLLKRISEKTGVHIIASTGFYYYPSMVSCSRSAKELSEWILYECETGIEETNIKPGILKCAANGIELTPDMEKRIKAVSIAQVKTGLPMYAHCSHDGILAYDMIRIFSESGANPEKIIIGHASRRLDTEYLESILKEGYCICIDQSFDGDEEKVADAVYRLCEKGYEKKLLFSQDNLMYNDFESSDKSGLDYAKKIHIDRYSFLQNKLIPEFEKYGLTKEQCCLFLNTNAKNTLNI